MSALIDLADVAPAFCRCGASANKPYCDGSHSDSDSALAHAAWRRGRRSRRRAARSESRCSSGAFMSE